MKEFKGTRDKLSVKDYGHEVRVIRRKNGMIDDIAQIDFYLNDLTKEENKANAVLFSSAYELLDALQTLMDGVANLPPLTAIEGVLEKQYKQAEKAINKALGL